MPHPDSQYIALLSRIKQDVQDQFITKQTDLQQRGIDERDADFVRGELSVLAEINEKIGTIV